MRWDEWVAAKRILPLFHLTSKGPLTINRLALPL